MNAYDQNIFENSSSQKTPLNIAPTASCLKKYLLKETEGMVLYEQSCCTVLHESTEPLGDEKENKRMNDLVCGKGKICRKNDVETQTYDIHSKARFVNTDHFTKSEIGSYVSNYDMHDTYINLEHTTESVRIDVDDHQKQLNIATYSKRAYNDLDQNLESNSLFQLSSMILQRILAGNIFYKNQKRFRNMSQSEPLGHVSKYSYRIKLLCKYRYNETYRNAISSMAWNSKNTDILAIGYGFFKVRTQTECKSSAVCLWNIKVNQSI